MLMSIRFKLLEDDIGKVGTQKESGMGGNERYISHICLVFTRCGDLNKTILKKEKRRVEKATLEVFANQN